MPCKFHQQLEQLRISSNYRSIPAECRHDAVDLTTNDYLGLARRDDLRNEFMSTADGESLMLTSSASRLLASVQTPYTRLEQTLEKLYGRRALLFNSGYHANTGIVSALADSRTLILADRLVHASIIDGITLSRAPFSRFRHNDFDHLEKLIIKNIGGYDNILVIVESVYSMDGDTADIERLIALKRRFPSVMLYVDEAHAFGVVGRAGLGAVASSSAPGEVDVVVGTLGKALASSGAFAIMSDTIREFLVNRARSLIFSTALAPINVAWSRFLIERMTGMDSERARLRQLARRLSSAISAVTKKESPVSHIQPLVVGDAALTIELSRRMLESGVKVLPIRTPTVPPSTERLRFSLSAAVSDAEMKKVETSLMTYAAGIHI